LVTISMLALCVGLSINALALYVAFIEIILEVSNLQNNNDFWLGGACGAKNHGKVSISRDLNCL
ncbi:MAG: hypothetical protein ACI4P4_10410, partial [Faecousia sp.]